PSALGSSSPVGEGRAAEIAEADLSLHRRRRRLRFRARCLEVGAERVLDDLDDRLLLDGRALGKIGGQVSRDALEESDGSAPGRRVRRLGGLRWCGLRLRSLRLRHRALLTPAYTTLTAPLSPLPPRRGDAHQLRRGQ